MGIKIFNSPMKQDLINFFKNMYDYMGYSLELEGKDADLQDIKANYQTNGGQFWVVYDENQIIGTIGLRKLRDQIVLNVEQN